jgi:hypothetical protein
MRQHFQEIQGKKLGVRLLCLGKLFFRYCKYNDTVSSMSELKRIVQPQVILEESKKELHATRR